MTTLASDVRSLLISRGYYCVQDGARVPFVNGGLPDGTPIYLLCLEPEEALSYRRERRIDAYQRRGMLAAAVRSLDDVKRLLRRAARKKEKQC